jgi:nitroreductase
MASEGNQKLYHEQAVICDAPAFETVVRSRRSVRRFTEEPVPTDIMRRCLDLALLAPTSSNLQSWEFHWVRSPDKKAQLVQACLGQPAAATAPELVVCVARPDTYRRRAKEVLTQLQAQQQAEVRQSQVEYYKKIVPFFYSIGPLNAFAPVKWVMLNAVGLFRPMVRGPITSGDRKAWAIKTTALACENLMLALRAYGFDSCPMEGFDEARVKKLLGLPSAASVVMVISAGKRAEGGIYGPQLRLPREEFVFEC